MSFLSTKHTQWIIGIDEVGRGPLAGPITVCATAARVRTGRKIQNSQILQGIKDSKKLSIQQREEWYQKLFTACLPKSIEDDVYFRYAISSIGPTVIDRSGVSYALIMAVDRCLKKLSFFIPQLTRQTILLDGNLYAPSCYQNQKTIIKGDEQIPLIAAASVIAKVRRDRYMKRVSKQFPFYGFDVHKGYGTLFHRGAILKHGLCSIHRKSFCKKLHR